MRFATAQLRRAARVVAGATPRADDRNWGGDITWYTPTDVAQQHGGVIERSARTLTMDGLRSCAADLVPPGSVILTTRAPIGNVAVTSVAAATNQGCRALIPGPRLDARFLRYWLQVNSANLVALGNGSTFQELGAEALASFRVPMPERRAQSDIADFLDRECERIEAIRTATQELPRSGRAYLVRRREELLARRRTVALRRAVTVLDHLRVPLNREERARRPGPYPYWGASAIQDYVDDYLFDEPLVLVSEDGGPFFDNGRDVAWLVSGPTWVNNHAHVLRPRGDWQAGFLAEALNVVDYAAYLTGATRDKLTQEGLRTIRIPCPEPNEQRAIVRQLDDLRGQVGRTTNLVTRIDSVLTEYRDALVAEAVTGKLDVASLSDAQLDESARAVLEGEPPEVLAS